MRKKSYFILKENSLVKDFKDMQIDETHNN